MVGDTNQIAPQGCGNDIPLHVQMGIYSAGKPIEDAAKNSEMLPVKCIKGCFWSSL